ncbi:LysR family transcriptional regulator [Clostridium sp. BJN0013]|uniref:LysR family transcriptional regulator n=1 Tax=Clostridium sp. BJN0013 TaxID=3236840 RepID=UPI0034C5EA36
METLSYKYFLVAAEELNITRAAHRLFISQQSLSQHIAKLENKYGVELFQRKHPMSLTYAGEQLVKKLTHIVDLERQISNEMQDIREDNCGRLVIGISYTRGRAILPDILPLYNDCYPRIEIRCAEGTSEVLEQKLLRGQIDIMVDSAPVNVLKIETIDIMVDKLVIIVSDKILRKYCHNSYEYIISHSGEDMDIRLFKDCPLLLLSSENHIRTIIDQHLRQKSVKPNIIMMSENVETLIALVVKGIGLTFCPHMLLPEQLVLGAQTQRDRPYIITLNDRSTDSTMILGYKKDRYLSTAAKNFISLMQKKFSKAME